MSDAASNKAIVKRILTAYAVGDLSPLLAALDDNVSWTSNALVGHYRFGGRRHGRGGVIEGLSLIAADYEITRYEVREMIAERNSRNMDFMLVSRWQFRAEKLVSFCEFFDTASVMQQQGRVAADIPQTLTA
jgi:ketosteroid isomerase-like protein